MSDADAAKKGTNRPRPKYQVFISSTRKDLHEEREAVTWEILKAGHIPAGMENFTATDERGWKVIQRTIDRSDYYVILVAGMYGTVDPSTGVSWTQREYQYAREKKIPVLAFLRDDASITGDKIETDPDLQRKLAEFKKVLNDSHHREQWGTKDDIRAKVALALTSHIQNDEHDGNPRPGWFRGDEVPVSAAALEEFARLSSENDQLRRALSDLKNDSVEVLELVDERGNAPQRFDFEAAVVTVIENSNRDVHRGLGLAALENFGEPPLNEIQEYANDVAQTIWCSLRVRNTGTKPARHVVADFVVSSGKVFIESIEKPSSMPTIPSNRWCFDAKEHAYVESCGKADGGIRVRQRIAQIAVGGEEDLIRLGVRPMGTNLEATVRYQVRSEDGVVTTGEFLVVRHQKGQRRMSREQALAMGGDD